MIRRVEDQPYKCVSWVKAPSLVLSDPRQITKRTLVAGLLLSRKRTERMVAHTPALTNQYKERTDG
jgi:hypothetical protein